MEQTECSETSAYKIQTQWNYPEENIKHTEHGESLKSRILLENLKILNRLHVVTFRKTVIVMDTTIRDSHLATITFS